ncbi:MAG: imidazole glycerol phosphate synthase subunit HisH [Chloroflexi bacterium]|nr:imidazole glycerol phosphate synthase subunit HisH [Chloroflexota bacterium]MYB22277.1 imidazole glycerol phosphate synthase subunit HisH [Chloroflexota bacterium]MYD17139.1 imidazole glycerol phosphate synthase subunit HisH [Chloroflexota bacterium]MYF80648.1 imidazole glycerol phosphate synthase subunit HisH [Chloroflexota bacterium]MYI04642.1 imidazole glycerol phosphate synthase subunit HisH [Chloroflexota bacterium]
MILDYGAGNLRSVIRAVERVGAKPEVASVAAAMDDADVVILPGVGAAADTMRNLRERGLVEPIREYIDADRPFLGVCMGLQALMTVSEEGGEHPCLDVLKGRVVRLPEGRKIPHMGWNRVRQHRLSPLFECIPDEAHFYFVHSYYCDMANPEEVVASTEYGTDVTAVVERGRLAATQFHPEKSGAYGLRIYRNFLLEHCANGTG